MKILYISHSANLEGAELCLFNLVKNLDRNLFEPVVVFPTDGPLKERVAALGVTTYISPLEWWVGAEERYFYSDFCLEDRVAKLCEIIDRERPDVIHTNTSVIMEGAVAASRKNIPHVWHLHEVMDGHPSLKPFLPFPLFYRIIEELSQGIVVVSNSAKLELSKYIAAEKLTVIHNGIEQPPAPVQDDASLRESLTLSDDAVIAVTVASISLYKGHDNLVHAVPYVMKVNPHVHFVLVGPSSDQSLDRVMGLARKLGVQDNIHYLGFRSDVPGILAQSDLFVLPSLKEAFPLAVLEAMAAGKAVVATDCCGPTEMVEQGVSGFIVPVNDPDALASSIVNAIADPSKLREMGKRGREIFGQKFTIDTYAEAFTHFYTGTTAPTYPAGEPHWAEPLISISEQYVRAVKTVLASERKNRELSVQFADEIENLNKKSVKLSLIKDDELQEEKRHQAEVETNNKAAVTELEQQIAELRQQLDDGARHTEQLQLRIDERARQLVERDRLIAGKERQLLEMYASLSWKITAPLRGIYDALHLGTKPQRTPQPSQLPSFDAVLPAKAPDHLETYPASTVAERQVLNFEAYESPQVSIIIPVFNQLEHTYSCLTSILANTTLSGYEVIIADDASQDDTINITEYAQNIRHIRNPENLGFLRNCNNAAAHAKGKYLLFLNNDTNVQKDWLKHMTDLMEGDATIGMTGSKLVYPDGRLQEAGGIIWSDANGQNYGRLDDPAKPEYNYVKDVDYISGASIMIRRELWDRAGGFDERFAPAYYEDTDLAFTVRKLGYRVVLQPKSVVVHFEGISHGTDLGSGIKSYQVRNKELFLDKWREVLSRDHFGVDENLFQAKDRSRYKKTVLFIDYQVPLIDKFAGSRTNYMYLRLLVQMGLNVKFIGADFLRIEPYSSELNRLGIKTLDGDWYRSNWKQWIMENAVHIDYVLFNKPDPTCMFLDFIKAHTRAKILYQGHDLHYLRLKRKYDVEGGKEVLAESVKYERIEKDIFAKSDAILTFSSFENEVISELVPGKLIATVPLYFYDEFAPIDMDFTRRKNILFVGGFGHTPNVDAVTWFSQNVLPLVLKQVPELVFQVIGSNPPPEITSLESQHIRILGFVSDERLAEYYQSTRMVVVPLRFGAGVKGKTIEALYHGLPVVSTSVGIEGIPDIESIAIAADSAEQFAAQVVALYGDPRELQEASCRNRSFVKERYSTETARKTVENLLAKLG